MRRMGLASTAWCRLREAIWKKRSISNAIKIRLNNAPIVTIATYASKTWTLRSGETRGLEVFEMRCLRAIIWVTRRERQRNEHVRKSLQMKNTITEVVKNKRLRWFGHVKRRPPPLKAMSPQLTEKISQIQDREAGQTRNGSPRCETTLGSLLLPQSAQHRTVVTDLQSAVWRERRDEESWASKLSMSRYSMNKNIYFFKPFPCRRKTYAFYLCQSQSAYIYFILFLWIAYMPKGEIKHRLSYRNGGWETAKSWKTYWISNIKNT